MSPDLFRWLPMSDRKTLPTVRVLFRDDLTHASALFYARTAHRCIDDDLDADRSEADHIVLSSYWGDPLASTLAHEHRHFQQHYLLGLPRHCGAGVRFDGDGTLEGWRKATRRFYLSQSWEMDALIYSMKVHRDELCEAEYETTL